MFLARVAVVALLFLVAGCGHTATSPTPVVSISSPSSGDPHGPTGGDPDGPNGSFTWVTTNATRPLCAAITNQVGHSWPIWVVLESDGQDVTLTMSEEPLPVDRFDEAPATFKGTRIGDDILAKRVGDMGGMSCPQDSSVTPQTGGDLKATISELDLTGEFTEVYGNGVVTFGYKFRAKLRTP